MKKEKKFWNYVALSAAQPFVVSFENTTDKEIKKIDCFDALLNANNAANNYGLPLGIVPIYNIPLLTYGQFLNYLLSSPFPPRIRMIESLCTDIPTLKASYGVYSYNLQGDSISINIKPTCNVFQNITDQIDTPVNFYFTSATKITISKIAPKTTITFLFYPMTLSEILKEEKRLKYYNRFMSFIKKIFQKNKKIIQIKQ